METINGFDVLVDEKEGLDADGLVIGNALLFGHRFVSHNKLASIKALQDARFWHVPPFALTHAYSAPHDEDFIPDFFDTNAEKYLIQTSKSFDRVPKGRYTLYIINGGLFIPFPEKNEGKVMVISEEGIDTILGMKTVFCYDPLRNKAVEQDIRDRLFSYDEFLRVSNDRNFLSDWPTYAVVLPLSLSNRSPQGMTEITNHYGNPHMTIPAGGEKPLEKMLDRYVSLLREQYPCESEDGLKHNIQYGPVLGEIGAMNTGCLISIGQSTGFEEQGLSTYGNSIGVSPLALENFRRINGPNR